MQSTVSAPARKVGASVRTGTSPARSRTRRAPRTPDDGLRPLLEPLTPERMRELTGSGDPTRVTPLYWSTLHGGLKPHLTYLSPKLVFDNGPRGELFTTCSRQERVVLNLTYGAMRQGRTATLHELAERFFDTGGGRPRTNHELTELIVKTNLTLWRVNFPAGIVPVGTDLVWFEVPAE